MTTATDTLPRLTGPQILAKAPPGTQRVIVAELNENDSDSMTDYYNHKTTDRVVIGFASSSRESFPALRKAAALFQPTAHLAPGRDRWRLILAWDHDYTDADGKARAWLQMDDVYWNGSGLPSHFWTEKYGFGRDFDEPEFSTEAEIDAFIANNPPLAGCEWRKECSRFEHRENWSMGGGNFLKAGGDDADGWRVVSMETKYFTDYYKEGGIKFYDASTAKIRAAVPRAPLPTAATITKNAEKSGLEIRFPAKPVNGTLEALNANGWRWHRMGKFWYHRDTPENAAFAESLIGGTAATEATTEAVPRTHDGASVAAALRTKADSLTKKIEHLTRDLSQNPTPKRLRELASRTLDGERLRRVQEVFYRLAELWDCGECPAELQGVRTVSKAEDMLRTDIDTSGGYYSCRDTGEYRDKSAAAQALQSLLNTEAQLAKKREAELRDKVNELRFMDVPGFFPTPPKIARQIVDLAEIDDSHRVLEPSAGIGSLAEVCPNHGNVDCIEQWASLADILSRKGFAVAPEDFMAVDPETWSTRYDRVVMNPPFENGQDADHVRHAFGFLKSGGRLVAIISAGLLCRSDRKSTEFRDWMYDAGADVIELPDDAFAGSDAFRRTGVKCHAIVINKPEDAPTVSVAEPEAVPVESVFAEPEMWV